MIVNLTPFLGPSADVGSAYEMGFMRTLGRPIFAYSNDMTAACSWSVSGPSAVPSGYVLRANTRIWTGWRLSRSGCTTTSCSRAGSLTPAGA
jgi:nucleoside 2-deoxyribosyltransferase